MRAIAGLLVILALVPIASSQNGTVCYGKMPFSKTACLTSSQSVNIVGQARPPTAVLMEIMGSGLPAVPLISGYTSQTIGFTSVVANKQTTTGQYWAEYLLVQDTLINNAQSTLRTNKFQYGSVTISNFETIEQCVQVTFLTTMAGTPDVKLSPHTQASEELIYLWLKDVTATGFKVCYHEGILFSGIHAFNVHYVAIAEQGQIESQRDIQDEHMKVRMLAGSQAAIGTPKFCQRVAFRLTYRSNPFVYCTPEQDSNPKCGGEFISWVHAIDTLGATVCARNSEDLSSGLRKQNVSLNCLVFGGRMDIVPGMVQLAAVPNTCDVFCRDVTFPANKFWTGLPMHVQLTVTWQKTPVIPNGHHEASAVWAESLTHSGFKACTLVAGRHFSINDNYPIPAVNWLAYQLPASQCVTPPLIGGSCALPDWYTGARCCSVTVGKVIALTSKILVSARHTKTQTFIDAMTTWSELSECNGTTVVRLCARELQNFDGLHQGIHLHWLLVENALPPFIPEHGDIGFPRQFYGLGNTMPAVCKDVTFAQNYDNLPIATVILSPKNCSKGCETCTGFSNNDFVSWIETRTNTNMRVCMKSLRACLYREEVKVPYIVVTEPRCAGKTTGFYLKDTFCHDYFQCNDGAYSDGSCGANQYFNLQTGACQATVPNGCQDPRCINQVNGFYLINTVCRSYFQCSNGFYSGLSCSGTQYFNLQLGACQNAVPAGCQDPKCNNIANGFYLINNLCKSYYQCQNGFYTGYNCLANQYYNLQTGVCQAQVAPGCQNPICIGKTNGFYLVNNRCSNYYQCADGIYTLNACANNQYFNIQTSQCQAGVPNGCQDPRCIGFNDGFYLVNNVCRNYYQCNGGFYTGFSCANNQYFNIQTGGCQATVPTGCQDPKCAGQTNGFYLINNLCKQYFKCQDGFYTGGSCAGTNGQNYFNLVSGTCQATLPSGCQDPRCTGVTNGVYRLDNFCVNYFRCADGFYTTLSCQAGSFIDLVSGTCITTLPSGCRDPRCTGVADGFYLVNNLCTSYYQCSGGFFTALGCTGTQGQYFNINTKQCQATVPAGCQDPRCAGRTNGVYLVNNLCTSYFRCQDGFYTGSNCQNGQYFNTVTGQCQTTLPNGCQDPRCSGRADGLYLLNNLCTSYYRCASGFYTNLACQAGQYFNTANGQCQTQLPAGCQDPRCIGRQDGAWVFNTLCTQYFTCTNSVYSLLSCQAGQYFNQVIGQCQSQLPSGCQDPRCSGLSNGNFKITTDNLCRTYFTCTNGQYTTNTCPTGQYFHVGTGGNIGTCQNTLPAGCADPRCNNIANGRYRLQGDTQCRTYYQCNNGFYTTATCPLNQYFHTDTQSCQSTVPIGCSDPKCIGITDGLYRLNNLCTAYYRCQGGVYTLSNCANGQYFNQVTGICQVNVPAGCQDPRCIGRSDNFYLVNNLCTAYFSCTSGVYAGFQCNPGNYYNLVTKQCQNTIPTGCQDPICIGRTDGFYVSNNLCVSYFQCAAGISTVRSCQAGNYFNVQTGQCQATTPSGCQDSFCQTRTNGNYPVDTLCRSYYTCLNGFKTINTCANNGYYNSLTRVCQNGVPNGCQHPDCRDANGLKTGNFVIDVTCVGYYSCSNGLKTVAQCQTGLYFNVQTGACQANVPAGCSNPLCQGKTDGNYLTNNLCTSYYNCASGVYNLRTCTTGYFNLQTGQCQNQVPNGCQNPLCVGRTDGLYLSNNLCTTYFSCIGGIANVLACPQGQYFNAAATNNNVNNQSPCQTQLPNNCQDPLCTSRADGYYITDGTACQNYYRCASGFRTVGTCAANTFINAGTGQCQNTRPAGCAPASVCSNLANGNYKQLTDQYCRTYYTCTSNIQSGIQTCPINTPYFVAVSNSLGSCQVNRPANCLQNLCFGQVNAFYVTNNFCTSYFQCTNQQVPQIATCANGQYFNTAINQCTSNVPATCVNPLCQNGNLLRTENIATDGTCTGGYRCNNGILSNQLNCGTQYYNVQTGNCETNRPAQCQARTVNLCAAANNGFYHADGQICKSYYQCINNQVPQIQTCINQLQPFFNTVSGQCQTLLPANQNCLDPRCYQINNNQIVLKTGGEVTDAPTCTSGFVCTNGVISNVATCQNTAQGQRTYYLTSNGQCTTAVPAGCTAPLLPPTCSAGANVWKNLVTSTTNIADSVFGLTGYNIGCSNAQSLTSFKLARNSADSKQGRYEITCCAMNGASGIEQQRSTTLNSDGNGDFRFLDRHTVECPNNGLLVSYNLQRNQNTNQMQFLYTCTSYIPAATACYDATTALTDLDKTDLFYLDRQTVSCIAGYALNKFQMKRAGTSPEQAQYAYKCCAMPGAVLPRYVALPARNLCTSTTLIRTEAECRLAAAQLNDLPFAEPGGAGEWTNPRDFSGCLEARDGRNKVYMNTKLDIAATTASMHENYRAICRTA